MSKIYDALLRAEKDRAAAATAKGSPEENRAPAAELTADSAPVRMADAPPAFPMPSTELHEPSPASTTTFTEPAHAPAPLRMDGIRRETWTPDVAHLPSLDERGGAVEQFRSLRSRMYEFRDLNTLKSVLVSSGLPQEGKSFVAANLAVSLARHKASRVLLIDGDMRRSSLHKVLGAPGNIGLTEYLSGKAGLMEVLQQGGTADSDTPIHAALSSLTFIPAGSEHDKAADLSGNRRFDELVRVLSPHFDWIVVDSSPVNLVADGVNLARACDGVLLIARSGVTKFQTAQKALNELKASRILGFVLNAVENPPQAAGYYGYDAPEVVATV